MRARDYRAKGASALKGHWALAIVVTLVAAILGGVVFCGAGVSTGSGSTASVANQTQAGQNLTNQINQALNIDVNAMSTQAQTVFGMFIFFLIGGLSMLLLFAIAHGIIKLIIGGAVSFGYAYFNLNLVDGKRANFGDLFSKMYIGKGIGMNFLRALYIFLWSLLFIIPGIIKGLAYSMAPYLLSEHPELRVNEAIDLSQKMMKGNKWRFFCLQLSFIGWILLGVLTLGIAMLWVNPYMEVSCAAFYRELADKEFGKCADAQSL